MELMVPEGDLLVKTLSAPEEMDQAYRLRHQVFSEELRWVPVTDEGLEVDEYDTRPVSYLGVFDCTGMLLGHCRLIAAPHPFMIDREFAGLLPEGGGLERTPDTAEVTRLCVSRAKRKGEFVLRVSNLLYKGIYLWSMEMGVRHLLMVVDRRVFRLLRLTGFPVRPLGNFAVMPDSVQAAAIHLDLREFKEVGEVKKPEFFRWISTPPAPVPLPGLWHGLY